MRTFVTTLGAAAIIGFGGLFQVATANAAPVPAPYSGGTLLSMPSGSAHDNDAAQRRRRSDARQMRVCLQQAQRSEYIGVPLPVTDRWGCPAS